MGAGALSAGVSAAAKTASHVEVKAALSALSEEDRKRLSNALSAGIKSPDPSELEVGIVGSREITNGWDAEKNRPKVVGHAPLAPRPHWLPKTGKGQANVDSLCWSLSLEQWVFFVRACVATETWRKIAEVKGEYEITMYDVNEHFVKPWTTGTGCSVALLMNSAEQLPAEGMFSHAWAGSVVETYNCVQSLVNRMEVPATARFFYCTFSMYQPQDGAPGGLSIPEQIARAPFAKVIESEPLYGMWVIHTTLSDPYERLWVVHEADVGIASQMQLRGLFDLARWTLEMFKEASNVKTIEGRVGSEEDRAYISGLIAERGGYERLDVAIKAFRQKMAKQLKELLDQKQKFEEATDPKGGSGHMDQTTEANYGDWVETLQEYEDVYDGEIQTDFSLRWRFASNWMGVMQEMHKRHATQIGCPSLPKVQWEPSRAKSLLEPGDKDSINRDVLDILQHSMAVGYPLGADSYPRGAPRSGSLHVPAGGDSGPTTIRWCWSYE